jgi:hypothetical protein
MNAATFPLNLSRPGLPVALSALLAGAALSAGGGGTADPQEGAVAIPDSEEGVSPPAKIIVLESPGQGTQAKNEAGVASAIALGPELRGSKASAIGTIPSAPAPTSSAPEADDSRPAGPRGLAAGLSGR